jgi:hypothetical protein
VNNQDPFASFAPGPTMPNVAQPPQQPPQQQQDPWATHMMTTAAPPAQAPAPMLAHAPLQPQMNGYFASPVQQMPTYTAPAPVQQPTYTAPQQQHVMQMPTTQAPGGAPVMPAQLPPTMMQAQPVQPPAAAPPMRDVYADPQNQTPDSPMGDVSAIMEQTPQTGPPAPIMMPPLAETAPNMQQQAFAPVPQANANPFDFGPVASSMPSAQPPTAAPPAAMPPNAPPSPTQNIQTGTFSPPMSPVNALSPQINADPFGYCFSPMASPVSGGSNAIVPNAAPVANPFGVFGGQQPPSMPAIASTQAVVPSTALNDDPFGVFGGGQQQPPSADPFGASLVPAVAPMDDDPFGVFSAPDPVAPPPAQPTAVAAPPVDDVDPWAAAGFGQAPGTSNVTEAAHSTPQRDIPKEEEAPLSLDSNGLPSDGEYYEARVGARSLGVMFYTAREIKDTLLQKVPSNLVDAMASRPIVSYVAKNSAACNAGIHLGHTILEVNGQAVQDAEHCADLIRSTPRPLNVRCFDPHFEVVLSENKHMVKYDTLEMEAPKSANEWKMKYVVVGGIVANNWTVNMYYSKVRMFGITRLC